MKFENPAGSRIQQLFVGDEELDHDGSYPVAFVGHVRPARAPEVERDRLGGADEDAAFDPDREHRDEGATSDGSQIPSTFATCAAVTGSAGIGAP